MPTTLESTVCILSQYFASKIYLFGDEPITYTCCKENIGHRQAIVGRFTFAGLHIDYDNYDYEDLGIAALRKF